ncbi:hypothetical protein EJ02DRAFT_511580 [Clathrospora elynae]|uniref:Rhodopsin domain-containing protein n=1 Tax=Clathrospora elynae TaxID=706981 RepID=A0A6A5SRB8_9PLEO|nr:hypothetical protein EJ02DRAFT_511580 [Clathrospora elynae]
MVTFRDITIAMWTLAGLCVLLTFGRYTIRWRMSLQFHKDDIAHLCALGWLLIFCSVTQALFVPTEVMLKSLEIPGAGPPLAAISEFCKLQTAQGATFYFLHWTVKFAFLLFYRELFWVSRTFIRAWWCVATFVLAGLVVAITGMMTQRDLVGRIDDTSRSSSEAFDPRWLLHLAVCARHNEYQQVARVYICVANVSTDLAVMVLPLGMLRKLRVRKTQKLGLVLVFSVSLLTIALELFRFVRNIEGDRTTNNMLYAVINANLTVIISCIPTYRSLWSLWQKSRSKRPSQSSLEGYARPRKSIQKFLGVESDLDLLDTTYNKGPAMPLQELPRFHSYGNLPSLPPTDRPPSYSV